MIVLYLGFAFAALMILVAGPPWMSWRAAMVRLAGWFAFPLAFVWLLLPSVFHLTAYGTPGISRSELNNWTRFANVIVVFASFSSFLVTVGFGFLCMNASKRMDMNVSSDSGEGLE